MATKDENQQEKTQDQLQAEAQLDVIIPDDESPGSPDGGLVAGGGVNDPVESMAGLLSMIGFGLTVSGLQNLGGVWSDGSRNQAIASAAVPVLAKYAFGQRIIAFLSGETPVEELALAMALAPVVMSSVTAYRADMAARKPANDEQGPVKPVEAAA